MSDKGLSKDEAELYDRQIRLWGIESQEKLRAANVLLVGITGVGSEVAKNILLAGINSLTILDDHAVTQEDVSTNFLLHEKVPLGNNIAEESILRAQALNPLVTVKADSSAVSTKNGDYFKQFTIVVATKLKFETIIKVDNYCREHNVKLIYADVCGYFAFSVSDLQEHQYFEDRVQLAQKRTRDAEKETIRVEGKMVFPPLNKVLILPNTKQDIACIKKISRPNNLFICLLALMEFQRRVDRYPSRENQNEDIEKLKDISSEIIELYEMSNITMDPLWDVIFANAPSVCAVLGGIVGQEVIKAVSHKEPPINNVFLFDPITFSGKELTVGP